MSRKTYYMVLGVSEAETAGGIRAAYHDLAKRLHPDVAGEQSTSAFRDVAEAYDVLSHPRRREAYNDELKRTRGGGRSRPSVQGPPAEPLIRDRRSILGAPESIRPSYGAMRERFLRNFTGVGVPKSEHLEGLNVEVLLSPEEAAGGCVIPVGVPVFARCPRCHGAGHDWGFPCLDCRQQGVIEREVSVPVRIPPLASPGALFELPLDGLGIRNFFLRLHVFVDG